MTGAREAALLTLHEVLCDGAYSNLALKKTLGRLHNMDRNEKNLLTVLVYGTISRHETLLYAIKQFSNIRLGKIADFVRIILETGIYQIAFCDKIPESAAVNESVKLAKKYGRRGADKFVNAVLRAFSRAGGRIEPPEGTDYLRIKYSFPAAIADEWVREYGADFAERLMRASNEPPSVTLRANALKISAEELCEKLSRYGAELEGSGLVRVRGFDIANDALYRGGFYSPQDAGAFCAAAALDPQPNDTIIDMCAAPGAKSAHIAEITGDKAKITAFDIHEHKIRLIGKTMKRLGITSVHARVMDSTNFDAALARTADRVLCDVPCSGWGVIRRKPDIKLARHDPQDLPPIQSRILQNGAEYLKHGGVLVYSTCTLRRAENEGVTGDFLKNRPDFVLEEERTFFPHTDGCDGFYICKMRKNISHA